MSIEIDVLNGDASWPRGRTADAGGLAGRCRRKTALGSRQMGPCRPARADRRAARTVQPGLACHVGIYFRDAIWDGRKVQIGGIGGVSTRDGLPAARLCQRWRSNAAIQTMRDHEAVRFAMLFCEPHNVAFYQARGWHPFTGRGLCRAAGGTNSLRGDGAVRVRFHPQAAATESSTYAACHGDPCAARGWLARRTAGIICQP